MNPFRSGVRATWMPDTAILLLIGLLLLASVPIPASAASPPPPRAAERGAVPASPTAAKVSAVSPGQEAIPKDRAGPPRESAGAPSGAMDHPAPPSPGALTIVKFQAKPVSGDVPLKVAFNSTADSSVAAAGNFTFRWDFGDGSPMTAVTVPAAAGATVEAFANHTYVAVGIFTANVNVSDSLGDRPLTSSNKNITVDASPIDLTNITANRTGGGIPFATQLTATALTAQDRAATYSFVWSFGDGSLNGTESAGAPAGFPAISYLNHTYTSVGTFDARVTVSDNLTGDLITTSHQVVIITTPPLDAWANATPSADITLGANLSLNASILGGLPTYHVQWSNTPGGCNSVGNNLSCTPTSAGTWKVRLAVTDAVGNKNTTYVSIRVNDSLVLVAHYTTFFYCQGSIGVLQANFTASALYGSPPLNYTWDFGDKTPDTVNNWNVTHLYRASGNYTAAVFVNDSGFGEANATLLVPATFASCGTVPPVSFAPLLTDLEVASILLVVVIVALAVLIFRRPPTPVHPPPMTPAMGTPAPIEPETTTPPADPTISGSG
jgi:PKD repeat protein